MEYIHVTYFAFIGGFFEAQAGQYTIIKRIYKIYVKFYTTHTKKKINDD